MTIFSKSSQKFDVLPFHGRLQFEKLKLSLSNARDRLKSGEIPNIETLEKTLHHDAFNLWEDFKTCTETLLNDQTFCGFKILLTNERGRVTRSSNVLGCEPASYLQITKSCFTKYSEYIELLLFHLHCRLVPWPKWLTLCNTCFNFISTTATEERNHNFGKLLDQKFGPKRLALRQNTRHS